MQKIKDFFKVRRNKAFYITTIAQLLIVIQVVLAAFGYQDIITEALKDKVLGVANAILSILALFGVVIDPTNKEEK